MLCMCVCVGVVLLLKMPEVGSVQSLYWENSLVEVCL